MLTWKQLPVWHLEANAGELPEVTATTGGCSDCLSCHNMLENALSILIAIFFYNSNKPRPQTESCVFSKQAAGEMRGFGDMKWS